MGKKVFCINCVHYIATSTNGVKDICGHIKNGVTKTDQVTGDMTQVCFRCRDMNHRMNCRHYEEKGNT